MGERGLLQVADLPLAVEPGACDLALRVIHALPGVAVEGDDVIALEVLGGLEP